MAVHKDSVYQPGDFILETREDEQLGRHPQVRGLIAVELVQKPSYFGFCERFVDFARANGSAEGSVQLN